MVETVRAPSVQGERDAGETGHAPSVQGGWMVICVALIGGYLLPVRFAYGAGCGFLDRLLYPISHSGVWHLLMNVVCLLFIWRGICARVRIVRFLIVGVLVQVLGSFVTEMDLLTLGASGWGYYLIGVDLYMALLGVDLLRGGERADRLEMFMLVLVVGIAVQGLFPFFNAGIHGIGLLGGLFCGRWVVRVD